ncbi:hypothetical protein J3R83DRAFT_5299 [Lanmaoa asiatica]|nr:hypothetical protein J3R83DRAFT_5299 [Lanmaoa asiatica]
MSSSSYHPPPHLHRVNLHSHGKRPFEECGGYDSDPDNSMPIQPTTSGTSSSNNNCFTTTALPAGPHNPETRNKRARSTSSTSTDDSSSNPSSSSGYNTAQSSSRSDISSDGPSALRVNAIDCPIHPVTSLPPFAATQDVHMSNLHLPIPPNQPQRPHVPAPPIPQDTLRTSLQRFAEFDRQIAALRTSLAATRSPPLPPLGPSVDGDPSPSNGHWHPNSSNFLSNGSSGLPPSTTTDSASSTVAVAPSETFNSLSTFSSSNDSANVPVAASTTSGSVPSTSFSPNYSNVPRYPPYPSYRPPVGASSSLATHERVGDASSSSSMPALMRPSSNENTSRVGARSSISVESSAPSSASHVRHARRSLSPLVFPPDPPLPPPPSPPIITDDILLRYRTLYGDSNPVDSRSHGRGVDGSVPGLDREVSSSRLEDHFGEQPRKVFVSWHSNIPHLLVAGLLSHTRVGDRVRVIREHSIERESVPSVFDVFNLGESSQNRNRPLPVREPVTSRYTSLAEPVPPRALGSHSERSRGPAPISTAANANEVPSQDLHTRLHSSWTSIPSSNSLMSESASERRHALALERFRARLRRSSFDADDESDSRWSGSSRGEHERENVHDLGAASPVPPSPSVESVPGTGTSSHFPPLGATRAPLLTTNRAEPSTSTPLQRSVSELFAETQRIAREEGAEAWLLDWDASRVAERERQQRERERQRERQLDRERQRERVWEWERERERQRERSSQDVRSRSFASGLSLASTSSAREESSHLPAPASSGPPRPSLGQLGAGPNITIPNATSATTTTNNGQQYSYTNLNLSSFQSGLFRDSLRRNAEVDQVSFSSTGPLIPSVTTGESRATSRLGLEDSGSEMDLDDFVSTRPPSPEWSRPYPYAGRTPPPPDYSPPSRNGLSFLRRGSVVNYDSQGHSQPPNRNTAMFTRPIPPVPSGSTRPTSHENTNRPAPPERTERDRFLPARILESFYRSHEDGRRNASVGTGQPYHPQHPPNQNHALGSGSSAVSRNERNDVVGGPRSTSGNGNGNRPGTEVVGENRRSSLGLGGSIRSRLARLASPQSSSNSPDASSTSRQRSPSRPAGARPQVVEQHRRGSSVFGSANVLEHESRPDSRSVSGPPHWAVNTSSADPPVMTRDAPWRASSGPRNTFAPPPPTSGSGRAELSEVANRVEEQRSRLRTLRQRLQLDRGNEGIRVFRPGMLRAAIGRRGNPGDYMPDELFDDSYEALLSLSSMLGDVRSRATPEEVIASLPTGTFREWKKDDSETRCPICLDDYEPSDVVTKLIECPHWLHKNCLEVGIIGTYFLHGLFNDIAHVQQWLRTANTCPVCREKVKASPKPAPARRRPHRDLFGPSETNHGVSSTTAGNGPTGRPPHTNPQSNNGRPVSFAAIVFDRLMSDGRDITAESWSSSPSPVPPPTRDTRNVYLERLRAQQQQQHPREPHQPPPHTHDYHDVYIPIPPPHEPSYHLRVPPTNQPGSTPSRQAGSAGLGGTDGPGVRPFGFVSLLRGQGSDSSMSTSSSTNMVVDEVGAGHVAGGRRSMASMTGDPGSGSGSFLDAPTMQRRETIFPFVPSSSGTFSGAGGSAPPPPPPPPQQQQSGFDAHGHGHPPTMVISSSTESQRDWRNARVYDSLFNMDASRSSSSSSSSSVSVSQPRPMGVTNRIPVDEDSPFEEYMFGWNTRGGQVGHRYPHEEEPTGRGSGEGASSGP